MSETVKHTAGPWAVFNGTDVYPDDGDREAKRHIADCDMEGVIGGDEQRANARLIAASPDLLEAVKGLVSQWNEFEASSGNMEEAYYKLAKYARSDWQKAIAAITKAGG